jgi:hypothetical protein
MGRRTGLTQEIIEKIVEQIRDSGMFRKRAAEYVGIPERTFHRWMERGENDERGIYRELYDAVHQAEAVFQHTAIQGIKATAVANPAVTLKWLSRRFPSEWGRRDNVEPEQSPVDRDAEHQRLMATLFERLERLFPAEAEEAPALPENASEKSSEIVITGSAEPRPLKE